MKILVFVENWDGIFKKSSYEAVSYSRELAEQNNFELITLCFNNVSQEELNKLWIHGLLHLFGYQHKKNQDFRIMSQIEKRYLKYIN